MAWSISFKAFEPKHSRCTEVRSQVVISVMTPTKLVAMLIARHICFIAWVIATQAYTYTRMLEIKRSKRARD